MLPILTRLYLICNRTERGLMVDIEAPDSETSDWDTSNSDAVQRLRGAAFDRLQTAGYHCLQILQSFLPLLLLPLGLLLVLPSRRL